MAAADGRSEEAELGGSTSDTLSGLGQYRSDVPVGAEVCGEGHPRLLYDQAQDWAVPSLCTVTSHPGMPPPLKLRDHPLSTWKVESGDDLLRTDVGPVTLLPGLSDD